MRREDLLAHPERRLGPEAESRCRGYVERRARREPVAYITGAREFWSLDLRVDPSVPIPRPETEVLVGEALRRLPPREEGRRLRALDLGTGSGNVALALASERPGLFVVATDVSGDALRTAKANAERLGLGGRVAFLGADWLGALRRGASFDAVVSNPPYLREGEWETLDWRTLSYEPRAALVAGEDGREAHRVIAEGAAGLLRPAGWLLMEIGMKQAAGVRDLLEAARAYEDIEVIPDLGGRDRVVAARRRR